jgi:nicotinamidase-related amidase
MVAAMLARSHVWPAPERPWLVCIDLQRDYVVPGRPRYAAANADVAGICAEVLGHARDEGWRVLHSQWREDDTAPWPRDLFHAPIEGLRPLISEPVFFRQGLSAFANPAFAAELALARGKEVFLIGFSLADTCLATALAAVDAGLSLVLVEDAIGAGATPESAEAARTVLRPFVRLTPSRRLLARRLEVVS